MNHNYCLEVVIELWFNAKVSRSNCSSYSYPYQQKPPQCQRMVLILPN